MRGLCKIINPETIKDLESYCSESRVIIEHCYGYNRIYCPKTCTYATKREMMK